MSKYELTYAKKHTNNHRKYSRKLFELNSHGELIGIYFSPPFEGILEHVPFENIDEFYAAYFNFTSFMENEKFKISFKLKPGEVITFNNRRVLHGRTTFPPTEHRHLQVIFFFDY